MPEPGSPVAILEKTVWSICVKDSQTSRQRRSTASPHRPLSIVIWSSPERKFPNILRRAPSGMVRAFNIRSGKLVWTFHTIPQPGETGHETWQSDSWKGRTGANVWSVMSVDAERGLVFLPIGSASYDFYGSDRKGQNLFANRLVALEAATGKLV